MQHPIGWQSYRLNIHSTIHAVCWQLWNFGQIHACFTAYKQNIQYALNARSYLAYKPTTLATRQRDVVVVRTALTAAMVVPSTMFKMYDPPNSETLESTFMLRSGQSITRAFTTVYPWKCTGTAVKPVTSHPWNCTRSMYSSYAVLCHIARETTMAAPTDAMYK